VSRGDDDPAARVAELRPVTGRRRFVPSQDLFDALAPAMPLAPEVLAALQAVDREVEAMDDGDDRFLAP